jgi:hypothetical protein
MEQAIQMKNAGGVWVSVAAAQLASGIFSSLLPVPYCVFPTSILGALP